jgi:Tfp pilus assembly protein PilN
MIKVNLVGIVRKKAIVSRKRITLPTNFMPIFLILIAVGFAVGGFWWYSNLTGQSVNLDQQIKQAEAQKAALDAVIKQDQIYEARKKTLEARVKVIEGLENSHVSPVLALDQLSEAIDRTQYVWLSSLDQKETALSMSGTGTSLSAIADFYSNLNATGYFKNVDLGPSQESGGNFTFSLKCEFAPPRRTVPGPQALAGGY